MSYWSYSPIPLISPTPLNSSLFTHHSSLKPMLIGKTISTVSSDDISSLIPETCILQHVFGVQSLPCCICSPLRVDNNPSLGLYVNNKCKVRFIDFATDDSGSLMDLLCKYWHCSYYHAVDRLKSTVLPLLKPVEIKRAGKVKTSSHSKSRLEVRTRPWQQYDYDYWQSYGVAPALLHWAEVYPISHKIITKASGCRIVFKADKHAYAFVERKEGHLSIKIYQPFNTKGFKWCSKMDGSVISLWSKLPPEGDKVIICSSLKDALCIMSQLHIPAIAPQGEGYKLSNTAVSQLKSRFSKVFISFDTDEAGKADARKLSQLTGFPYVIPDLGSSKDFSDYYKALPDKKDFLKLAELFS